MIAPPLPPFASILALDTAVSVHDENRTDPPEPPPPPPRLLALEYERNQNQR